MKLTQRQVEALRKLADLPDGEDAYTLRANMHTLWSLRNRGLVHAEGGLGSMFSPRTGIVWTITPAGRAAVEEIPEWKAR